MNVNWTAINTLASVIATAAYILTALYIRAELKHLEKDRYLSITGELFSIWQSREFMEAQLWLLHRLEEGTWEEFVREHRGDHGEAAFHRVGSFYDRVGTLVRLRLINEQEILSTMGAYAIAVWQKIEPLVREARRIENSVLFDDFERLLPACYECYVPALGTKARVTPFALPVRDDRIEVAELKRRIKKHQPVTVIDVRGAEQFQRDPRVIPGALHIPLVEIQARADELPRDREVVTYCA